MTFAFVDTSTVAVIDDWPAEEEAPTGKRPKRFVFDPVTRTPYVFKEAKQQRLSDQIWAEMVGSVVAGDILGLEAQHVSVGIRNGRFGNLLKFVYTRDEEQFFEGYHYLKIDNPHFDPDGDHTIDVVIEVSASVLGVDSAAMARYWARVVAFDALISNTDRHTENWAIIESAAGKRMAPVFDNGTSLGCEVGLSSLNERWFGADASAAKATLDKFIRNGRHHLRLSKGDDKGSHFRDLCSSLARRDDGALAAIRHVAEADLAPVADLIKAIRNMPNVPKGNGLTEIRGRQMLAILHARQGQLRTCL